MYFSFVKEEKLNWHILIFLVLFASLITYANDKEVSLTMQCCKPKLIHVETVDLCALNVLPPRVLKFVTPTAPPTVLLRRRGA